MQFMTMQPDARATAVPPAMTGSATVTCLMAMMVLMSMGTVTLRVLLSKQAVIKRAVEVDQAYLTAEAGVDLALGELRNAVDYGTDGIGIVSGAVGRGTFTTTLAPPFTGPGQYTVTSTGHVDGVARTIVVQVGQTVTAIGFAALNSITNTGNGYIDTYDSTRGTYASQVSGTHAGSDVSVKTNGNITLSGNAKVYGDAHPGPTGTVSGAAGVTGSTTPSSSAFTLPTVTYAPPIASTGAYSGSRTFTAGSYHYSAFTLSGNATATFTGNVQLYVDGNFSISGNADAVLAPGAKLTIYQNSGTFTISGNGVVNQDQRPSNLVIDTRTTSAVTVSGNGAFFGNVLAPNAPLTASGNAGIYGALQVKSLTLSGNMSLHYDKSLGTQGTLQVRLMQPHGRTAWRS